MKNKTKVGAIIQARTGSTRLPGKVFMNLAGRPMLFHIIERLKSCRLVDKIILATTREPEDQAILDFADEQKVLSFAGDTDDVQARFIAAATTHDVNCIVRICSDSPFIDPKMIDILISDLIENDAYYAMVDPEIPSAQEGFEVVTLDGLMRSREMTDEKQYKEHVTLLIRRFSERFHVRVLPADPRLLGTYRLSVDNFADYQFAAAVYDALYQPGKIVDLFEMVALLEKNPEIRALNAHITQKPTDAKSNKVAFLIGKPESASIDASLSQAETTARILNEVHHCGICVFGPADIDLDRFSRLGYKTDGLPESQMALMRMVAENDISVIIVCGRISFELDQNFAVPVLPITAPVDWIIKTLG